MSETFRAVDIVGLMTGNILTFMGFINGKNEYAIRFIDGAGNSLDVTLDSNGEAIKGLKNIFSCSTEDSRKLHKIQEVLSNKFLKTLQD